MDAPHFDLWTARIDGPIPWDTVDSFLSLKQRESERVEYRRRIDADATDGSHRHRHPRVVETIAAMANSGGGLIFVGVADDEHDRPKEWPWSGERSPKVSAVEAVCRTTLDPYVQVSIGIAEAPDDRGQVVVVKVPDAPRKPVWCADRGILVRQGSSTVVASLAQIRGLFAATDDAAGTARSGLNWWMHPLNQNDRGIGVVVLPDYPNPAPRWNDDTDEAIESAVHRAFGGGAEPRYGTGMIEFRLEKDATTVERTVVLEQGLVYRRQVNGWIVPGNLAQVAAEIKETWAVAMAVARATGRPDDLTWQIHLSVSGFAGSVSFGADVRPPPQAAISESNYWEGSMDSLSSAALSTEITERLLERFTRAEGFRRVSHLLARVAADAPAEST